MSASKNISVVKRLHCPQCHYPQTVCVCDAVQPFFTDIELIILQHPTEVSHAKNTARLINLGLPGTRMITGENEQDFSDIKTEALARPNEYALIYPSEDSLSFESEFNQGNTINHLIFIDATWRKAYKMWKLNPWLKALPGFHFNEASPGNYLIRKAPDSDNLSTLEAVAYTLKKGFNSDVSPLLSLFSTWQKRAFAKHQGLRKTSPE